MALKFLVDLGDVRIDKRSVGQVEAAIQKAALSALADIDFQGDLRVRFPKEWLGIWINPGELVLDEIHKQFAKQGRG
jgi:hypothetical protein